MTKHRCHHVLSAIERLYLPRSQGGRGLLDIRTLHINQVRNLRDYFLSNNSLLYRATVEADSSITPLNLSGELNLREIITQDQLNQSWKEKAIRGAHPCQLEQSHVDQTLSNNWLLKGRLFAETEGFFIAIQDKIIPTKNYRKYILKENIVDTCRKCNRPGETIEHIIDGCTALAATDYLHRHNNIAKIIHQDLALQYKLIEIKKQYYQYSPAPVLQNETHKLYWDRSIITDRTISANKPDIVLFDCRKKEIKIIDIAIPLTTNLITSYNTKINKYTDLSLEMERMYKGYKTTIIPLIMSSTAVTPRCLPKHLEELNIKGEFTTIQKAVVLETCNITRRFLQNNNHH